MVINFLKLLQDSGNFMRNQLNFSVFGLILLVGLNLTVFYLIPRVEITPQVLNNQEAMQQIDFTSLLLPSFLTTFVNVFITILLILNIKLINRGNYQHFFQPLSKVLKAFLSVLILNLIMVFPLAIGIAFGGVGSAGGLAILILPLMATGIYIFVKLSLLVYAYLLEDNLTGISDTLRFTWQLSRGKMGMLFLFCILSYVFPHILTLLIGNVLGNVATLILSGFLNLFMVIFSFRFYQVYRAI